MKFSIAIKYYHPALKIGLENVREAWLLNDMREPKELKTEILQGNLHYRFSVSGK